MGNLRFIHFYVENQYKNELSESLDHQESIVEIQKFVNFLH